MIMRSLDLGLTWQRLSNPPTVPLMLRPHPMDPLIFFVASGDGIFKTGDGGASWRRTHAWPSSFISSSSYYGGYYFDLRIDPVHTNRVYIVARGFSDLFLVSGDGGESWRVYEGRLPSSVKSFWVDPNGSGVIVLGQWRSRDQGATWMAMKPFSSASDSSELWGTWPMPSQPGWIYGVAGSGATGKLYVSKDSGETWTESPSPLANQGGQDIQEILFDPDLPTVRYAKTRDGLYASVDSGASWHKVGESGWLSPESLLVLSSDRGPTQLIRQCAGGGAVFLSYSTVRAGPHGTGGAATLTRTADLAAGPNCVLYAARSMASDVFVAKLSPGGREVLWSTYLGGSEMDAPVALVLDDLANVYLAGNTASSDFPITAPRSGPQGKQNVFVVKMDTDGSVVYSAVYGGEGTDRATALAVSISYEVSVTGLTNSKSLPVTAGAFQTQPAAYGGDGFAIKLGWDASTIYVTYLPQFADYYNEPSDTHYNPPRTVAVAVEANGSALVGGAAGKFGRLSPDGSQLTAVPNLPGQVFTMETGPDGSVYAAGQVVRGARSTTCYGAWIQNARYTVPPGDVFIVKLRPETLEQVFMQQLAGTCQSWPGSMKVGRSGEVDIGVWSTGQWFPLSNPVITLPSCSGSGFAVVSRLGGDGSTLKFSTYLDMCGAAPAITHDLDGSLYAGVSNVHAGVVKLPVLEAGGFSLSGAVNAFSGAKGVFLPGTLLTITGQNLTQQYIDLGLNHSDPLPKELGGVRILFDGIAAEMFQIAPERLICILPLNLSGKSPITVQVLSGNVQATPLLINVDMSGTMDWAGFLTHSFPNLPPGGSVDALIRNADGTINDAQHPAAPGSTVRLFATGFRGPGQTSLFWNAPPPQRYDVVTPLPPSAVHRLPGFIHTLFAVDLRIPDSPGPGVYAVPVQGELKRFEIGRVGTGLGVWVK